MLTKNQKGAVAIEMAIVTLFILVPLLLGTIDLAIAIYNQQVLTNASREGARAGIARSSTSVETVVQNYCANRLIPSGSSPSRVGCGRRSVSERLCCDRHLRSSFLVCRDHRFASDEDFNRADCHEDGTAATFIGNGFYGSVRIILPVPRNRFNEDFCLLR